MDDQVLRAMRKWPDVPAVYGWLRLGRRGQWFLVDRGRPGYDAARDETGSPITSPPILDFLGRNYAADQEGAWYWQNGPQRVYVDVETAPLVLRVLGPGGDPRLVTHTGRLVERVDGGWLGPNGEALLRTDAGPAVVHDLDLATLDLAQDGDAIVLTLGGRSLRLAPTASPPAALGFVPAPRP